MMLMFSENTTSTEETPFYNMMKAKHFLQITKLLLLYHIKIVSGNIVMKIFEDL